MKFPRTIRLDESDAQVYETPATPGEWAVPGSFVFLDADPSKLAGKRQQAFGHGFLGTESFGWSTLVEVAEISQAEYEAVVDRLAAHFVEHYGAPDMATALPTAREEAQFAVGICDHQTHTLLMLERELGEDGIVERFRVVRPNAADHENVKLWTFVDDD
ncbi:MAG: DUF6505 family protein [Acidiferrobacterales bacterium]